jgi:hypothetical protein
MEFSTQVDGSRSGIVFSRTFLARETSLAKVHAPIAKNTQEVDHDKIRGARFF